MSRQRFVGRCRHRLMLVSALFSATLALGQMAPNEQTARTMHLDRFVVPDFPPFLRQSGVLHGTVVAAVGRDATGRPGDVLVLESSDPRFAHVAVEAIREWTFKPFDAGASAEEKSVSVVRFLFTTGSVSIVPLSTTTSSGRRTIRAESPVELPNFSHLDSVPKRVRGSDPEFPRAARGRVADGTVVVKYFIDHEGRVRLPVVLSTNAAEFGVAALAALGEWRYEVPRVDGKPVIAMERHSFHFSASSGP